MKKHEIDNAIKQCKKNCFEEDQKVMLDESVMRARGGIFIFMI